MVIPRRVLAAIHIQRQPLINKMWAPHSTLWPVVKCQKQAAVKIMALDIAQIMDHRFMAHQITIVKTMARTQISGDHNHKLERANGIAIGRCLISELCAVHHVQIVYAH